MVALSVRSLFNPAMLAGLSITVEVIVAKVELPLKIQQQELSMTWDVIAREAEDTKP
jgi:hypothetical protein